MAQGFASGFSQGYGLVQKTIQDKRNSDIREEQLEQQRLYQNEQLGLARERNQMAADANEATAQYRADMLEQQKLNRDQDAEQFASEAPTRADQAAAAAGRAEAAKIAAEHPKRELDLQEAEQKLIDDTNTLQRLYDISQMSTEEAAQYDDYVTQAFESLKGSKAIDINVLMRADHKANAAEIATAMQNLQNPEFEGEVGTPLLAAISDTLDIHNSRLVGTKIDDTFTNAPPEVRGGEILDITVNKINQASSGTAFGARLSVKVRGPDGKVSYYYPPLNEFRGGDTEAQALMIEFSDAAKAMAGRSMMLSQLRNNTQFTKFIDDEKVKEYGLAKLNADIAERVDKIGEDFKDLDQQVVNGVIEAKSGGILAMGDNPQEILQNKQVLRDRVRSQLLYGKPTVVEINQSERFLQQTRDALQQATISIPTDTPIAAGNQRNLSETRSGAGGRNRVRSSTTSLSQLGVDVNDIPPQVLARAYHLFDGNSISRENSATLMDLFRQNGLID